MEPGARRRPFAPLVPGFVDLACLGLAAPLWLTHAFVTHDLWWHLALGHETLREGHVPVVERFSYTAPGAALSSHAWLADALFAGLERLGGLGLVELLGWLLVAATLRVIYALGRELGGGATLAFGAAAAFLPLSLELLILRPQLFTYLFFGLTLLAWRRHEGGSVRALAPLPLVFALWSNLHGGVLLGLAFLAGLVGLDVLRAYARDPSASARAKRTALALAASAVASCVHPLGAGQIVNALRNTPLADPVHTHIDEWLPPSLDKVGMLAPFAAAAVVLAALQPRRPGLAELVGLVGTLGLALRAWRHVPLLGLVGGPILAAWATRTLASWAPPVSLGLAGRLATTLERVIGAGERTLGSVPLALVVALVLGVGEVRSPVDPARVPSVFRRYPVATVAWVRAANPQGPVFHSYRWGGFLIWAMPDRKVYIDSRMMPFRDLFLEEYLPAYAASPGWEALLEKRGVLWALLERDAPLVPVLRVHPGWRLVHEDAVAVVFVRAGAPNERIPAVPR